MRAEIDSIGLRFAAQDDFDERADCGPACDCSACENERAARANRFPRTTVVLEIAELADRMRFAAASLEALAANATAYEPGTLRRHAATMVRSLVAELSLKVSL